MKLKWQIGDEEPIIKELDDFDLTQIKLCLMPSADVVEVVRNADLLDLLKLKLLNYQNMIESHGMKLGIQICLDEINKVQSADGKLSKNKNERKNK